MTPFEAAPTRTSPEPAADRARLLAVAEHDLRQPLQALTLYISLLECHVPPGEPLEFLAKMDHCVELVTRQLRALFDLNRLEAGALKPEPIDFSLDELMEDIAAQSSPLANGARVRTRRPPVAVRLKADPDLLETILFNMLHYALEHSQGADVLLSWSRVGERVEIQARQAGAGVVLDDLEPACPPMEPANPMSIDDMGLALAVVSRMAHRLGYRLVRHRSPGASLILSLSAQAD
jgi:signal transduction histidine kinase